MTPQEFINFWKQKIKQNKDENSFLQSIVSLAEQGWQTNQDWMNGEVEKRKIELENTYINSLNQKDLAINGLQEVNAEQITTIDSLNLTIATKNDLIANQELVITEKNAKIEELNALILQKDIPVEDIPVEDIPQE